MHCGSVQCLFDCVFDQLDGIYFFMYLIKFFFSSLENITSRYWFLMFFLYSKCLACFNAVLFRLSCWTTWLWPEGSLSEWYSNKLIQWVVLLEINRTAIASSLVLSLLFKCPCGDDLLMELMVRLAYPWCQTAPKHFFEMFGVSSRMKASCLWFGTGIA